MNYKVDLGSWEMSYKMSLGTGKLGNELKMGLGSWEMRTGGGELNYKTVWEVGNKLGNTTK